MVECKVVLWDAGEFTAFAEFMQTVKAARALRVEQEFGEPGRQITPTSPAVVETTDEQNETVVFEQRLISSMEQAVAISRGEMEPARVTVVNQIIEDTESAAFVHFPEPEPVAAHPPATLADATALAAQYITKHGVEKTRAVIEQYGGPRIGNIPEAQLGAFAADLRAGL